MTLAKPIAVLAAAFGLAGAFPAFAGEAPLSYNNDIGPILSEHCFHCHGPDSAARKPKKHPLRLDRPDFAYEPRDSSQPVIIKGQPDASQLIRRVTATNDDVMPPPEEQKPLKPAEISLLKKWIAQGGKYEKHWSLLPPVKPLVPEDGRDWARNPIDNFVARKLAENGLTPNPAEEKTRLFRKLGFDLTGLPPDPPSLRRFVRDSSDDAYEKAVDRMLASDACAEQFARWWLDAVRYADTQGIHLDYARSIWPYRDWVISAFKTNMPFDRFSINQIAGDMLPHPTEAQKIASGYNRLLETTSEGGAISDEYAAIYAKDRVDTTAAVWLGLTTGCATCHDHKFDPITMKDFYSLTAFFRNNTSSILDGPNGNNAPLLFVPAKGDRERWKKLEKTISETRNFISARADAVEPRYKTWRAQTAKTPCTLPKHLAAALTLPLSESNGPSIGDQAGRGLIWAGGTERVNGPFGPAPLLTNGAVVEEANPAVGRTNRVAYGAFLLVEEHPTGAIFSRMDNDKDYRGWDLFLLEGRPMIHIIDKYSDRALEIEGKNQLESGKWHHVMAVFDGRQKGADAAGLYVDGLKIEVDVNHNELGSNLVVNAPFRLGARSSTNGPVDMIKNGRVFLQDVRFYDRALRPTEVATLAAEGLARVTNSDDDALKKAYLAAFDSPSQRRTAKLAALSQQEQMIRQRGATTLVMEENPDGKPKAHVLLRGNYLTQGDEVSAATPSALPPMRAYEPRSRLGLAHWIMSGEDPLVARVTVNRLWAQIFGTGIVETTEDFGVMGSRPSNQDLLDWLAVEFMDSSWDFRHMVKTMVMSSTYRQSETVSPEKLEKDPLDKLLSRSPRLRLDAEEIRDQALAASGLITRKIGGPPVKPYQPEGVWETVAMKDSDTRFYKQDTGDSLYRRSLYTYWKRIAPPPNMEILNAPTRETFCTRRDRTDTPLQALVTLNDTQFIEASRRLAANAIAQSRNFDTRLDNITQPLMGRPMTKDERALVRKMEQDFEQRYQSKPSDATALLAVGDSKANNKLNPAELAAWTLVASEILNLDETLTK